MAIVYAEFRKGAIHNNLTHSNEEFFYLLSGEMHAEIDNQSYTLKNGDGGQYIRKIKKEETLTKSQLYLLPNLLLVKLR